MRLATKSAAVLLLLALSAQTRGVTPEDFMAARRGELTQYGKLLFHVDFGDGRWTHRTLPACPTFTQHAFALYERQASTGTDRFLVAYNLQSPPAKSKDHPWQGGIVAAPLAAAWGSASGKRPDENSLVPLFNRVFREEKRSPPAATDTLGPDALAACFAALAGEEPVIILEKPIPADAADASPAVDGISFPVKSAGVARRIQMMRFSRAGLLEEAHVDLDPDVTFQVPAYIPPKGATPTGPA